MTAIVRAATVGCERCHGSRTIDLENVRAGQLLCESCDRLISSVDTSPVSGWIDQEVERKRRLQASGQLKSRIQTTRQNDQQIDRDGLHAEFAACLALCPDRLSDWQTAASSNQRNRGRDVRAEWTGLPKSVEIKFTRRYGPTIGKLIVRPPSGQGRRMRPEFVDDAYYLLLTRKQGRIVILGWIDRERFLDRKEINPVGLKGGQVECWGVLWKNLIGLSKLPRPARTTALKLDKNQPT